MTSEWVSEAQRIAKEAGEKAANEVAERTNVALGWLTQNAPAAAMCVLESIVFRKEMPALEVQRGYAQGDWARADAETQALAINDLLDKARDAALEEAAKVVSDGTCGTCHMPIHWSQDAGEYHDGDWVHAAPSTCMGKPSGSPAVAERIRALKGRK